MHLGEVPTPIPKSNQVLVRVKAASVNPVDLKLRSGLVRFVTRSRFPRQMGIDFSGIVEQTGSNVTGLNPGDRMFGWADYRNSGTFAEYVAVDAELTVPIPDSVSFEQTACFGVAGSTVLKAFFDKAHLASGMDVLVNGCMGGVGHMAVQIAKGSGAKVTGFCGSYDMEDAKQLGCDEVYDYRSKSAYNLSHPFDIIFDTPGTLSFSKCLKILKPGGTFIHIIPTSGLPLALLTSLISNKSYTVFNTLGKRERLLKLAELAEQGILKPVIGKTVPLNSAVESITTMEKGERIRGKLVIKMD